MISDGECQEGTTWESLLIGAKHNLDNLVILVDYNIIQALSTLEEALPLDNLVAKFKAFNWVCAEVNDGHSFEELISVIQKDSKEKKPRAIIVNTIKGKGFSFAENNNAWHHAPLSSSQYEAALKELLGDYVQYYCKI